MNENMIMNGMTPPQGAISPITFKPLPDALKGVQNKRPEEKLYMIVYVYGEDEKGFELCLGRMECYDTIGRLVATYSDLKIYESVVLVEVLAVNRDNKAEWMMKHPHNAPTLYQFCKSVESYFPNSDFHIDDYATDAEQEVAESESRVPAEVTVSIPVADDEMTKAYREIMNEKEEQ